LRRFEVESRQLENRAGGLWDGRDASAPAEKFGLNI